jgi:RNA polymerase-binding transcription factor DksA
MKTRKTMRGTKAAEVLSRIPHAAPASEAVPEKWRWHYRALLSLQSRLLRDHGDMMRAAAEPLEPHSLNEADSATDEFDHDLALSELSAEQGALYEVNEALKRISNGTYGICEETGEAIPAARLRAIPWTRFKREVQERLEKKGIAPRAHLNKAATVRIRGRIWLGREEETEELAENPPPLPRDEALTHVFTPPDRGIPRNRTSKHPKAAKQKGRRT